MFSATEKFHLLQWNARSVLPKKHEVTHLINLYNPAIFAISETWLTPRLHFNIPGYSVLRDDRPDGYGGAAILVNNSISFSPLSFPPHGDEINAVGVNLLGIDIISIYIPSPNPLCFQFIKNICAVRKPTIILGDFNCHHSLWGSDHCDGPGLDLVDLIDDVGLCVINSGLETRLPRPGHSRSCVDLTLCSASLTGQLEWRRLDLTHGSDHYPICSTLINRSLPKTGKPPLLKYKLPDAKWDSYSQVLDNLVLSLPEISSDNLDTCMEQFSGAVTLAADHSIPLKNSASGKLSSPPWWDRECTEMIKARKEAEFRYVRAMSVTNLMEYNRILAKSRRLFRKKKREGWKKFCASLSPSSSSSVIWKNFKGYSRGCSAQNPSTIPQDLAAPFLNIVAPPYVPLSDECPSSALPPSLPNDPLDLPFSLRELEAVLNHAHDTAPGVDGFPYSFYKNSGAHSRQYLLSLINTCFSLAYIPDNWKTQLIIPILKSGKPPNSPNNFRPIALSPVIGKILEHLIKNRLEWFVESRNLLAESQYGFRKGFSTMDGIGVLVTDTRIAFSKNESVLAVFLDISAAYDSVLLSVLRSKLRQLSIPTKMCQCICNFMSGRNVKLHIPGINSDPRTVWRGLPQGSVLSPLLYSIYTADLHSSLNSDCQVLQYADDLCLYIPTTSIDQATGSMQVSLNSLNHWLVSHGLSLSAPKSSVVVFTRKRVIPDVHLEIDGSPIRVADRVKFLGVILDSKLSGVSHINYVHDKCEKKLNLLRALAGVWWGAHPFTLKLIYNATIRSLLDYATFWLEPCSKVAMAKLDIIQSKSLRIVLGCMRSTPTNALQVESGDPPLPLRRQYLADKFMFKSFLNAKHKLLPKLSTLDNLCRRSSYWSHKDIPLVLNSLRKLQTVGESAPIRQCNKFPVFSSPYNTLNYLPNVVPNIGLNKETIQANDLFSHIANDKWPDHYRFYTDASKLTPDGRTGIAVYNSNSKIFLQFQCPPESSVFTGECIGILEACLYISSHTNISKAVIFSDSRSALEAIVKNSLKDNLRSSIISEIKNLLYILSSKDIEVILVWIPGHMGIAGNECADVAAKAAVTSNLADRKHFIIEVYDLIHKAKLDLFKAWQSYWSETSKAKGGAFAAIQPSIPPKPWFYKFKKVPKVVTSVICRIRIGHCCSPVFLHKIRVRDSSLCECGLDEGTVDHIFLNCPRNNAYTMDQVIKNLKIQKPVNVRHLLSYFPNPQIICAFIKFIVANKIKL